MWASYEALARYGGEFCRRVPRMRVSVNFDVCASTGACTQVAPEIFEIRSDGYLYILVEEPSDDQLDAVRSAEEMCPTGAITLED
jgi:ferredoxin